MRVSMYKADHWLTFGLGGCIGLLENRVKQSNIGFQYSISQMVEANSSKLNSLSVEIVNRGIESYGDRDAMIAVIDNWILAGAEGAIRILLRRAKEVLLELDCQRLTYMRNELNNLICEMDLRARQRLGKNLPSQ